MEKIVVITGAGRGIGQEIGQLLGSRGYVIAAHYGQSREAAEGLVSHVIAQGGKAFAFGYRFDAEDGDPGTPFWDSFDAAAHDAGFDRGADIFGLVNNAGVTVQGGIDDMSFTDYQSQMYLNAAVPYFLIGAASDRIADGGRIVNLSSQVATDPAPGLAGYAMSKRAVDALTVATARTLGPRGITVNAVAPSLTLTDMTRGFLEASPEVVEATTQATPLRRLAETTDIAGVVAMLFTDDARWVTGQIIAATGGS